MAGARPHRLVAGHGRGRPGQCMVGAALQHRARVPATRLRFLCEQQEHQGQRGGGVCGRELPGISRAQGFACAARLRLPQVPFQNAATRGAGTRGCHLPLVHESRRQLARTEASRRLRATLCGGSSRSRGSRRCCRQFCAAVRQGFACPSHSGKVSPALRPWQGFACPWHPAFGKAPPALRTIELARLRLPGFLGPAPVRGGVQNNNHQLARLRLPLATRIWKGSACPSHY